MVDAAGRKGGAGGEGAPGPGFPSVPASSPGLPPGPTLLTLAPYPALDPECPCNSPEGHPPSEMPPPQIHWAAGIREGSGGVRSLRDLQPRAPAPTPMLRGWELHASDLSPCLTTGTHFACGDTGWAKKRVLSESLWVSGRAVGAGAPRDPLALTHRFLHSGGPPRTKTQGLPPTGHYCFHGTLTAPAPLANHI